MWEEQNYSELTTSVYTSNSVSSSSCIYGHVFVIPWINVLFEEYILMFLYVKVDLFSEEKRRLWLLEAKNFGEILNDETAGRIFVRRTYKSKIIRRELEWEAVDFGETGYEMG